MDGVGPVLEVGEIARAIVAAIRRTHAEVHVTDRGSYVRVLAPGRCVVSRAAIEAELGRRFELRRELEQIMPSFQGRLALGDDEVSWNGRSAP